MYHVYFLRSKKDKTYYIGYTGNLKERIDQHNKGKTKSIKHKLPMVLIYIETYSNKTTARKREIGLKRNSSEKEKILKRLNAQLEGSQPSTDHP